MIEAVSELPPLLVAELFGVAPRTAIRWSNLAQSSWADYLDARTRQHTSDGDDH